MLYYYIRLCVISYNHGSTLMVFNFAITPNRVESLKFPQVLGENRALHSGICYSLKGAGMLGPRDEKSRC